MWDDGRDQPVIGRHERGDDGTLLEICTYEEMFTLDGHCPNLKDAFACEGCMPGGQPDFAVIADHMTDILGDYYDDRADRAAYMPLTLPYTRALRAHGYQRHAQGTRHPGDHNRAYDTYCQEYRSLEGHRIEMNIPMPPAHGDTPASPLTIQWIYLGRTAPGVTYPATNVPADTPPADVAELITTYLALHPRTPLTPGDATNDTDAPEHTDTPTTT
ncbi:hypothetical protein [Nonomuraea sp. NPDC023979]|uniref:hypothetical protein n=1 Tax=Nonomuraea sp. NPDC023979 TaxID=3154796 RepID=UPI0033DF625C